MLEVPSSSLGESTTVLKNVTRCPGGQLFAYDEASGRYNGIQCSGVVV